MISGCPLAHSIQPIGSSTITNKYTYNSKELNDDFALNWHDYGARWYDAALGRWGSVDPLSDVYASESGYNYVMNNPLLFIDPDGMSTALWSYDEVNNLIAANNEAVRKADQAFWQDFDRTTVRPGITGCPTCPQEPVIGTNGNGLLGEVTVTAKRPYKASPGQPKVFQWLGELVVDNYSEEFMYRYTKTLVESTIVHDGFVVIYGHNLLPNEPNGSEYAESNRVLAGLSFLPGDEILGSLSLFNKSKKYKNADLAGRIHPKTGVPFDDDGFPDFSNHLYPGGDIFIVPTGNRTRDAKAANKALGFSKTPKGYRWHHHQQTGRMQLVDEFAHDKTGHIGGFSLW